MDEISTNEHVSEGTETVKEKTQEQAAHAVERTRGVLRTQVDQRSTQAGEQARAVAETLRQTASHLSEDGDPQKARYAGIAEQGADRLEQLGGYLTNADANELLTRVESIGRKRPWLVAGSGLVAGLAAARFLKASSRSRLNAAGSNGRGTTTGGWERPDPLPSTELNPAPAPAPRETWEEQGVGAYGH
jgi:hypothetical protein